MLWRKFVSLARQTVPYGDPNPSPSVVWAIAIQKDIKLKMESTASLPPQELGIDFRNGGIAAQSLFIKGIALDNFFAVTNPTVPPAHPTVPSVNQPAPPAIQPPPPANAVVAPANTMADLRPMVIPYGRNRAIEAILQVIEARAEIQQQHLDLAIAYF